VCILCYAEDRKLTRTEFENCWTANDDGVGIAYREKGQNVYIKGLMTLKDAWDAYQKVTVLPHAVHFRLTSTGKKTPDLTHPFIVENNSNIQTKYRGEKPLLFHNGTIVGWESYLMSLSLQSGKVPEGEINDTRVAAMLIARLGEKALQFMAGRFILWRADKAILYGHFEEEKGVFFSNTTYRTAYVYNYKKKDTNGSTSSSTKNSDDEEPDLESMTEQELEDFFFENTGKKNKKNKKKGKFCKCKEPFLYLNEQKDKYFCLDCNKEVRQ
jgi:predicted glutamine amidotransferase